MTAKFLPLTPIHAAPPGQTPPGGLRAPSESVADCRRCRAGDAFARRAAHDVAGAATGLHLGLEMFADEHAARLSDDGAAELSELRQQARLMLRLVDALTRQHRASRKELAPQATSLTDAVDAARQSDRLFDLALDVEGPAAGLDVLVDRELLCLMLEDLLRLAARRPHAQATFRESPVGTRPLPPGYRGLELQLSPAPPGPMPRVSIDEEAEALALASAVVARHGGELLVDTRDGHAQVVRFTLPGVTAP